MVPSLQLTGSDTRLTLDLNGLSAIGVRIVGRLAGIHGSKVLFSGSLRNQCALSDLKMNRLLNTIDEWAANNGLERRFFRPKGSASLAWKPATGYRPDYSWLHVAVLDRKGRIRHDGGVVATPGIYVMGLQFLRRRKSALIDGAGADAHDLSDHLLQFLHNAGVVG